MPTNFFQSGIDLENYIISTSAATLVQPIYRKSGTAQWGTFGSLYSWGYNNVGQLGLNDISSRSSPVVISTNPEWSVVRGSHYTNFAIKKNSTLWAWGQNNYGQLGLNDRTNRSSPVLVGSSFFEWKDITVGNSHTLALTKSGRLYSWGRNFFGGLGLGDTSDRSSPVQVGALTNWSIIDAGNYTSYAIKTDGTLWVWGYNNVGQLGTNNNTNYSSPVQVGTLTNWSTLAATEDYVLAIKTDGTLWAWGANGSGQLGNGGTTGTSSPIQIGSLTNWSKVYVNNGNYATSFGIKTDGTLWSWGGNLFGQQGNNDTTSRSSPVQIGALTNWASLSPASLHTLALKTDGTLWAWGYNANGNLGNGLTTNVSSPIQIGTRSDWTVISGGWSESLGLLGN